MKNVVKRTVIAVLLLCTALSFACFAACGSTQLPENPSGNGAGNSTENSLHTHTYVETVNEKYLKSAATCTEKAVYYKSCSCGEKGEDTFEYGTTIPHDFNQQIATDAYKISDATCTEKAKYHYSCVCGLIGETFFEYGNLSSHNYNQEIVEDKFKACDANCTQKAQYYYSCSCGACGTNTFNYGNALEHEFDNWKVTTQPTCTTFGEETRECLRDSSHKETRLISMISHNYVNQVIENKYIKSYANYDHCAVYYYSCTCGAMGEQTFEYGNTIPLPIHTLTFNPNNGEDSFAQPIVHGDNATEPSIPERQDYEFLGWYNNDTRWDFNNVINDDLTLVAKWNYTYGKVEFNTNGGNVISPVSIKIGTYYILPIPMRDNYAFVGWYNNGVKVENSLYVTDDVILTAQWQRYQITSIGKEIVLNGKHITATVRYPEDSFDLNSQIYVDDNCTWAVYKTKELTEKYEYNKIIGLQLGENKSWVVVTYKEGYSTIYDCVITSIDYTGVFLNQDGTTFTTVSANNDFTVSAPSSVPKSDNFAYEFSHWETDGEKISFPYIITNKIEFVPVFKAKSYTITYYLDGGQLPTEYISTYTIEESVELPVPTKSLYNYGGWYTSTSLTGNKFETIEKGTYGNKCFYANWLNATEGVEYILSGNEYHISNYTGSATEITLPDTLEGKAVTKILSNAFQNNTTLTSILLPKNLTEIGSYAFDSCMALEQIAIPNTVTTIGSYAFNNCVSLKTVEMSNKVTNYPSYLFCGCVKLSVLNVRADCVLKSIGSYAFGDCTQLTSIFMPSSVVSIKEYAFSNSTISNVYIDNLESWCNISFGYSDSNPARYLYLNDVLLENLIIPETIKTIKSYSFMSCYSLKTITLSDSVTSIESNAFNGCQNMETIMLGKNLEKIGWDAFDECNKLTGIYIDSIENWCKISFSGSDDTSNPLEFAKNLYIDNVLLTDLVIPDTVGEIKSNAFWGCLNLKSVYIPDSVTSIGNYAFYGCDNIEEIRVPFIGNSKITSCFAGTHKHEYYTFGYIFGCYGGYGYNEPSGTIFQYGFSDGGSYYYYYYIPKTIKKVVVGDLAGVIPDYSFNGCYFIEEITIGKFTQAIGSHAFDSCSSLKEIEVPDSVTSIGSYAFDDCISLTAIKLGSGLSSISSSAFEGCVSLENFTVSEKNIYYKSEQWNLYTKDGKILVHYAIGKQTTTFTIPNDVEEIGDCAFMDCSALIDIVIPNNVTSIGDKAFYNCSSLTSIAMSNNVTSIGYDAFRECSSLVSITIPNSVTSIGSNAFSGCSKLVEVINKSSLDITYGLNVKTDGTSDIVNKDGYLFYTYNKVNYLIGYVGNETSLTLPENYNGKKYEIYGCAFYNCSSLTSVTIPDSVTSIGYSAFEYCSSLTSIIIPDSVTSIGSDAFRYCRSLTSVAIGNSVTSIGYEAFRYCSSLVSVTIGDSVTSIGSYVFEDCHKLVEVINKSKLTITKGSSGNGYIGYYALNVKTSGSSEVVNIDGYLFYTYDNVNYLLGYVGNETSLTLPENYNGRNYVIYKYAFYNCSSLTSVTIPNSVTLIGYKSFYGCSSLTSITIPNSVTLIAYMAFYGCSSLTSITIPDSVTIIGDYAFV